MIAVNANNGALKVNPIIVREISIYLLNLWKLFLTKRTNIPVIPPIIRTNVLGSGACPVSLGRLVAC